jgi:hypothetical protein
VDNEEEKEWEPPPSPTRYGSDYQAQAILRHDPTYSDGSWKTLFF